MPRSASSIRLRISAAPNLAGAATIFVANSGDAVKHPLKIRRRKHGMEFTTVATLIGALYLVGMVEFAITCHKAPVAAED